MSVLMILARPNGDLSSLPCSIPAILLSNAYSCAPVTFLTTSARRMLFPDVFHFGHPLSRNSFRGLQLLRGSRDRLYDALVSCYGRLNFQPIINQAKKWLRLAVNITPF